MKSKTPQFTRRITLLTLLVLCVILLLPTLAAADSQTAADSLQHAWQLAQDSGHYSYRSLIDQTVYPAPLLTNAGKSPTQDKLAIEGWVNLPTNEMEMTLWQDGSFDPKGGVAIRVEGDQTYGRVGQDEWQEIDNVANLFAPGGDPLGFLAGVKNVQEGEIRDVSVGRYKEQLTQYTFEIDGPAFASHMRQQMEQQLHEQGKLPAGMQLSSSDLYRNMAGGGELWLDANGLPNRLVVNLDMPPQGGNGRITAVITTDYYDFDHERITGLGTSLFADPQTWITYRLPDAQASKEIATNIGLWLAAALIGMMCIANWRSRKMYGAVAMVIVASMLFTPLLQGEQVYAFFDEQQAQQVAHQARQAEAAAMNEARTTYKTTDWNPHQAPLSVTSNQSPISNLLLSSPQLLATTTFTDTIDTDNDGLSDFAESQWGSDPTVSDSDGDTLTDGTEVLKLGTMPTEKDTDGDGVSDALEVNGFQLNGQTWYLNPLEIDSNKDDLYDGAECAVWVEGTAIYDPTAACPDSDGDGTPDLFDADNDNDLVEDNADVSPLSASDQIFNINNQLEVDIAHLEKGRPVFVDLQLRPTDAEHLTFNGRVFDWPTGDTTGQITRYNDTTWATTTNPELQSAAANAAYGDIRLTPMLEMVMPYQSGHYANLPLKSNYVGTTRDTAVPVSDWLDGSQLDPYGITVQEDPDSHDLIAHIPLSVVNNNEGDAPVAFGARMLYWPEQGSDPLYADWGTAHQVRLVWLVQMLTDTCINPEDDPATCSREDTMAVIHVYDDDWTLTGMQISEEHGTDVAIMYEDPAQDVNLDLDDQLWVTSWNLNNTFLRGRDVDDDGQRDVRIDNMATEIASWAANAGETSYVQTVTLSDQYPHEGYIAQVMMTETVSLLNTAFAGYEATNPTFLFAKETTNRQLGLTAMSISGNAVSADLDPVNVTPNVMAQLSWAPYQHNGTGWTNMDAAIYLTLLESRLQKTPYFTTADSTQREANIARGKSIWAQLYYASFYQGVTNLVEVNEAVTWLPSTDELEVMLEVVWPDPSETGSSLVANLHASLYQLHFTRVRLGDDIPGYFNQLGEFYSNPNTIHSQSLTFFKSGIAKFLTLGVVAVIALAAVAGLVLYITGLATGDRVMARYGEVILASVEIVVGVVTIATLLINIFQGGYAAGQLLVASATALGSSFLRLARIGLVVTVVLIWGFFLVQWLAFGFKGNTIKRNTAIATAIAGTIIAIVFFVLSLTIIGLIIVLLIQMIDLIFDVLLGIFGIQEWLTEQIAGWIYDVDRIVTNLGASDRLDVDIVDFSFTDPSLGFVVDNSFSVTLNITNTLHYRKSAKASDAKHSVFEYYLRFTPTLTTTDQHADLVGNSMHEEWHNIGHRQVQYTTSVSNDQPVPLSEVGTGVNMNFAEILYFTEAYAVPYEGCWLLVGAEVDCDWEYVRGSIHNDQGKELTFDILPNTLTEFAAFNWNNGPLPFPVQRDSDNDGLLSKAQGGTDPNDRAFDSDGDGLSDKHEIINGTNPRQADSDFDGLTDREEMSAQTDPLDADTDGDGLGDEVEVKTGWLVIYAHDGIGTPLYTRVWSSPHLPDTDMGGLDDFQEFTFGTNPHTATDADILENAIEFDNLMVDETEAPELLLQFDDAFGTRAFADSSGNGLPVICTACPTITPNGRYGHAVTFDGVDDYIEIPFILDPATTAFSAAAWVKPSDNPSPAHILDQVDDNSTGKSWLYIQGNGRLATDLGGSTLVGGQPLTSGQWYYVAVTYNGTWLNLYLDGHPVATEARTMAASDGEMVVGVHKSLTTNQFNGVIDEVVVFDHALSESEMNHSIYGRYNPNDHILAPGANLTYQATIANNLPGKDINGYLYGQSHYEEPAIQTPAAAFHFEQADYITTIANSLNETSYVTCAAGNCPTLGAAGIEGNGIQFADDGDFLTLSAPTQTDDGLQIDFFLKVNAFPPTGQKAYILDTEDQYDGRVDIYLDDTGHLVVDWKDSVILDYTYCSSSGSCSTDNSPTGPHRSHQAPQLNMWYHIKVEVSYDSAYGGSTRLYLTNSVDSYAHYDESSLPLFTSIGAGRIGNSLAGDSPLKANLDEMTVAIRREGYLKFWPTFVLPFEETEATKDVILVNDAPDGRYAFCSDDNTCPTLTSDGKFDHALSFDGSNDYLSLGKMDFVKGDYTIGAWFKTTTNGAEQPILSAAENGSPGVQLSVYSDGRVGYMHRFLNVVGGPTVLSSTGNYGDGQWHYITAVRQGENVILYVDGEVAASDSHIENATVPLQVEIGRFAAQSFSGSLDELVIIPAAVDAVAVQTLMNSRWPAIRVQDDFVIFHMNATTGTATPYHNALAYLDDSDNLLLPAPSSSTDPVCTTTPPTCPQIVTNSIDRNLLFNGTGEYLNLGDVDFTLAGHTIGLWFKTSANTRQTLFAAKDVATGNNPHMLLQLTPDGSIEFTYEGNLSLLGPSGLNDGQWHYAMISYASNGILKLWVDGDLKDSSYWYSLESPLLVEIGHFREAEPDWFNGEINELVMLDKGVGTQGMLSFMNNKLEHEPGYVAGAATVAEDAPGGLHRFVEEIEAAVQLPPESTLPNVDPNLANMKLYLPFEEVPGVEQFDDLIVGNQAMLCLNSTCPAAGLHGISGRAAYFDGQDDFIARSNDNGSLSSGSVTIAAWVKADHGTVADMRYFGGIFNGLGLFLDTETLEMVQYDNGNYITSTLPYTLPENEWIHVTAVLDDDNSVASIYLNGQMVDSITLASNASNSIKYPVIGSTKANTNFLHGYLDDVRIYNIPLSATDIEQLVANSVPMMHFDFDEEASATHFMDNSPNGFIGRPLLRPCNTVTIDKIMFYNFPPPLQHFHVVLEGTGETIASIINKNQALYEPGTSGTFCNTDKIQFRAVGADGTVTNLHNITIDANLAGYSDGGDNPHGSGDPNIYVFYTIGDEINYTPETAFGADGKIGNTVFFDGTGFIEVAEAAASVNLIDDFTIMTWVKTDATSIGILAENDDDTSWEAGEKVFYLDEDGYPTFVGYGNEYIRSTTAVNNNNWHHIAVTWDASENTGKIFVDGIDVTTSSSYHPNNPDNSTSTIKIGSSNHNPNEAADHFRGEMDELVLYGRPLTPDELYSMYLREQGWYGAKSSSYLTIDADEPVVSLLSDYLYRSNGYIQLAVSANDPTSYVSRVGIGVKAPGETSFTWSSAARCSDSTKVWCPAFDSSTLAGGGVYEIQFRAVDAVGHESVSPVYQIIVDDTAPAVSSSYNGEWITAIDNPDTDLTWSIPLNGAIDDPTIGAVAGSGVLTETAMISLVNAAGEVLNDAAQPLIIDGNTWSVDYVVSGARPDDLYSIEITVADNVGNKRDVSVGTIRLDERPSHADLNGGQLSTRAISQTTTLSGTVSEQAHWSGELAHYHFEEAVGSATFSDNSGNGYHGNCTNCPTITAGLFGQALSFDGVADSVDLSTMFNPISETFSLSLWFYVDASETNGGVLVQQTDGSGQGRTLLYFNSDNKLRTNLGLGNGTGFGGATTVTSDTWHHAVFTFDGTTGKLYLDGQLDGSGTLLPEAADGGLNLGSNRGSSMFLQGMIDEAAVYDRVLSEYEIDALTRTEVRGVGGVELSLEQVVPFSDTLVVENWQPAVVANPGARLSTWAYTLPTVTDGFYQIRLRSSDADGNNENGRVIWRGAICDVVEQCPTVLTPFVSYLPFDEGSGNTTADTSSNSNDGTLNGNIVWSSDTVSGNGYALDFDGVDDYVELANESQFDLHVMSVAFWVKVDNFTTNWQAMITKGDGAWRVHRCNGNQTISLGQAV